MRLIPSATRVASALLLLCIVATTQPAHADPATGPRLLDVQLSDTSVTVSGLAWHDVTVRVHLTSPVGIVATTDTQGFTYPSVRLERTGGGGGQVQMAPNGLPFSLASGTAEDGWWEGVVHVTAGYDGGFTVTDVWAMENPQSGFSTELSIDPRTLGISAQLQVTGLNIPHLSIRQSPDPVTTGSALTLFGTVADAHTGVPVAGLTVAVGTDTACSESVPARGIATASDGSWRETFPVWDTGVLNCAFITTVPNPGGKYDGVVEYVGIFNVDPNFHEWVSAQLASARVRVGGTVAMTGKSSAVNGRLSLQRLVGSTWRTVGTATVQMSGRFTLIAQPPSRGTWRYRVLRVPTRHNESPATSSVRILVAR